jgi:hypothetical protein
MIDTNVDYKNYQLTISNFRNESEAQKYIEILKKKFDISVKDASNEKEYYYNDNLFKIINITPTKAIEKPRTIFLELNNKF